MTVMVMLNDVVPPEFVAVMVYTDVDVTESGVPLTTPVDAFKDNPEGNPGLTEYPETAPPEMVGLSGVIAEFTVNMFGDV